MANQIATYSITCTEEEWEKSVNTQKFLEEQVVQLKEELELYKNYKIYFEMAYRLNHGENKNG